jgi:hypothetical protein
MNSRQTTTGTLRVGHPCGCPSTPHAAFTLFEVIIAITLSVTLLALIGTTINLFLTRIDASRNEVEEAQLARSVLTMIANDIRGTTIYKPQDTSSLTALAVITAAFDVDSIDKPKTAGGTSSASGASTTQTAKKTSSSGSSSSGSSGSSSNSSSSGASDSLQLGLNGTPTEVYIDVSRLPNMEELFGSATGYTNASVMPAAQSTTTTTATVRPSDIKSVRYYVREGAALDPSDSVSALSPEAQASGGGLVRQEIDRAARTWADQSGNQSLLESGQVLIAPEVTSIEFSYFDGSQTTDMWDMAELKSLPKAIEVRIWITPPGETATADGSESGGHEYRQTVFLPMASLTSASSTGTSTTSSSTSTFGSSSTSSSGSNSSSGTGTGGTR